MKTENLQDKKSFFYQYHGQKVFLPSKFAETPQRMFAVVDRYIEGGILQLKRFSSITPEIGLKLANLLGLVNAVHDHDTLSSLVFTDDTYTFIVDFNSEKLTMLKRDLMYPEDFRIAWDHLRSLGFAVPFRDYKLQEMKELGWFQYEIRGGGYKPTFRKKPSHL